MICCLYHYSIYHLYREYQITVFDLISMPMNITLILYIILQIMYDLKVNGLFISWKAWDVLRQKIRRRPENLRRWSATDSIYWTVSRRPSETSPSVNSGVKQWKQIPEFDRFSKRDPVNGDSVDASLMYILFTLNVCSKGF